MRTTSLVSGFWTALAAALFLAACGKTETPAPSAPAPPPPVVTVTTLSVEMSGPRSVAPGESVQFTAMANRSDGTRLDVTNTANWRSFNARVLSMSATGLATGREFGEAIVNVTTGNRNASREVIVVPTGTYRLVGLVGEADLTTAPVVGAHVEVTGPTAGPSVNTDGEGRYRLYGAPPGNVQMRVTKEGYQPNYSNVVVSDHQTQNFPLTLTTSRADVTGTYTLTITADASCSATLPPETRSRTYAAVVTQLGPQLDVTLTGPTFALNKGGKGRQFRGRVEPGQVVFTLNPYDSYYYFYGVNYYADIAEQLTTSLYLVISGSVVASISTSGLSGSLDGSFLTFTRDLRLSPLPNPAATCRSASHQFALSR